MLRARVRTLLGIAAAIVVMLASGSASQAQKLHRGSETRVRQATVTAGAPTRGSDPTQGGPDNFGYAWIDSLDAQGPSFSFLDIAATGTDTGLGDDDYASSIFLPFTFSFYGTNYNFVSIGSNGTVYFEDSYLGRDNTCIPQITSYSPQSFIALYWDDLDPSAAGQVLYGVEGVEPNRSFVVQWQGVTHFDSSDAITAQVILFEGTNNILMQYADPSAVAGASATVGIQSQGSDGLAYSCDQARLGSSLAVCFFPMESADPFCSGQVPVELQSFEID